MASSDKEKSSNTETKTAARAADAPPEIIGDEKEHLLLSAHDLTEDVDPAYAGEYELLHGFTRLAVPDGKGGFLPVGKVARGRIYEDVIDEKTGEPMLDKKTGLKVEPKLVKKGAPLRLNAIDAYRMLKQGVVARIDGQKPDSVSAEQAA